jgi:glyoxylase-like metal-dependent hydrolase (beta-lactamase superfamily II)
MKKVEILVLYPGYSAAADFGALGWSTVALIKADDWVGLLDSGGHTQRRQLVPRIEKYCVKADDIRYIFLTHLHWDHANNVDLFPNAKLIISKAEWDFVQHDNDGAYYPPTIEMLTKHNLTIVKAAGEYVAPGIRAYLTPGHTIGSTTYVVEDNDERYALVGDAAKNWYEIETGKAKMTKNAEWSRQSIEKIRSLSSHILPGHDGWVDIVDGKTIPRHGNDVIINYPEGITMDGKNTLRLYMD